MARDDAPQNDGPGEGGSAVTSTTPVDPVGPRACEFPTFEYDSDADEYRAVFDGATATPTVAVVSMVAAITGDDPVDLDPLHASVDSVGLDDLCARRASRRGDVRVRFRYEGFDVELTSYGRISVRPRPSS